jgi:two-component system sensor histidine kinase MtrB
VTALVAAASLLREHLDAMPADARRPAELLTADVMRLRRLVEELVEISRLDAGREDVRPEPVNLPALIDGIVASRGWRGVVRRDPGPVASDGGLVTDPRRLERIVGNLLSNAVEHGGRDVTVEIRPERDAVSVRVTDRGPGIPAEHLPHVFDRFYQADPARTGAGSGLGLAIARENARLLGGDLSVRSTPGEGTMFVLTLPVTQRLLASEVAVAGDADSEGPPRTATRQISGQGGPP